MSDLGNLPRDFEEWFAKEHGGMTAHSFAKIFSIREPKKLLSLWELKQKEVDSLKAQLNNMEACYIEKKKQVEDQQKRIDEYEKLTTSIRNEFDLWSDDSEFADVIEAQIENLEALRGANDSLTDMRQKVENQINNGARLTKHQIDL